MMFLLPWLWALLVIGAGPARADRSIEEAQIAELDRIRAEVANEIQLAAYDLVDELVYGFRKDPVFPTPTPVVLAGVSVPVGLGTGLQALLENHVTAVLAENPTSNIQLVLCPECTAVVVHSGPEGTVISRGYDNPAVLERAGAGKHALFVDVEAEGAWLVLRARITRLTPELPIVWSRTIASSASTPPLLRQPGDLQSAAEARKEYFDVLRDRGSLAFTSRMVIRSYATPENNNATPPPPFLWLQVGTELGTTDALTWTSSLVVGYSFIPDAYQGIMAQARVNRLLTGRVRSHTRPDLYAFVGASVLSVWGAATVAFREEILTSDEFLAELREDDPRKTFGALQLGLDLRLGNRIGMALFLETLPSLSDSDNIGSYLLLSELGFQTLGTEVIACF